MGGVDTAGAGATSGTGATAGAAGTVGAVNMTGTYSNECLMFCVSVRDSLGRL